MNFIRVSLPRHCELLPLPMDGIGYYLSKGCLGSVLVLYVAFADFMGLLRTHKAGTIGGYKFERFEGSDLAGINFSNFEPNLYSSILIIRDVMFYQRIQNHRITNIC